MENKNVFHQITFFMINFFVVLLFSFMKIIGIFMNVDGSISILNRCFQYIHKNNYDVVPYSPQNHGDSHSESYEQFMKNFSNKNTSYVTESEPMKQSNTCIKKKQQKMINHFYMKNVTSNQDECDGSDEDAYMHDYVSQNTINNKTILYVKDIQETREQSDILIPEP